MKTTNISKSGLSKKENTMLQKKLIIIAAILIVSFSFFVTSSDLDYKVIKRAVKGKNVTLDKGMTDLLLRVSVIELDSKKSTVEVTIPLALVEALIESCPGEAMNFNGHDSLEFSKVMKMLRKSGANSLVEVTDVEENVKIKIWLE